MGPKALDRVVFGPQKPEKMSPSSLRAGFRIG